MSSLTQTVTQWFPKNIEPVYVGVYEVFVTTHIHAGKSIRKFYWNGRQWEFITPEWQGTYIAQLSSTDTWRGLATQSKW